MAHWVAVSDATQSLDGSRRRARLAGALLYLVCDAHPGGRDLGAFARACLAGGVDVVQLRDKDSDDSDLLQAGAVLRKACRDADALFIINDRPDLAQALDADGAHLGQNDIPVAEARRLVGPERLVGLSTHTAAEVDAARDVDYIGVGPVYATPTKPGREAVGPELVAHAAARANVPFFAIGGITTQTVGPVLAAGTRRVAVVRALADAEDPETTARALRAHVQRGQGVPEGAGVGAT